VSGGGERAEKIQPLSILISKNSKPASKLCVLSINSQWLNCVRRVLGVVMVAAYRLNLETEPYNGRREGIKKTEFCWIAIDHFSPW